MGVAHCRADPHSGATIRNAEHPLIHAVRKLAREIHRRSIWQVLGVYVVGARLLVGGIDVVAGVVGLPLWTADMAAVLLLIGLPMVIATTVVQSGIAWLRIEDEVDPNELVGLTPAEVHVVPEAHPLYRSSLFTWRNAMLGGVAGAVLLATSVVAYLSMWALGIGPVGSLIAQGVINPNDALILAEFENRTDDSDLSRRVTDAFASNLTASTVVRLVDTRLGLDAALNAAERDGVKLIIHGDVTRVGSGHRVTVAILRPNGTSLARFHDTVDGEDELGVSVAEICARLRERLGEPLRAIRSDEAVPAPGPTIP